MLFPATREGLNPPKITILFGGRGAEGKQTPPAEGSMSRGATHARLTSRNPFSPAAILEVEAHGSHLWDSSRFYFSDSDALYVVLTILFPGYSNSLKGR